MPKSPNSRTRIEQSFNRAADTSEASGIYTWVISTDTVYSDRLAAAAFGFDPDEARNGMPLQRYLARIHPCDLPRVAKSIHDTMLSNAPFNEHYRVCHPDGSILEIDVFGCCFHDSSNEPTHHSGIIVPATASAHSDDGILGHLLAAHDIAHHAGKTELAARIVDVLREANQQDNAEHFSLPALLH